MRLGNTIKSGSAALMLTLSLTSCVTFAPSKNPFTLSIPPPETDVAKRQAFYDKNAVELAPNKRTYTVNGKLYSIDTLGDFFKERDRVDLVGETEGAFAVEVVCGAGALLTGAMTAAFLSSRGGEGWAILPGIAFGESVWGWWYSRPHPASAVRNYNLHLAEQLRLDTDVVETH